MTEIKKRPWETWWDEHASLKWMRTRRQDPAIYPFMAEIAARGGSSALDVGCETCLAYPHFRRRGLRYAGLDFTRKFVDRAGELYPEIEVTFASAVDIPYPDDSFDTVFCKDLLEHVTPEDCLKIIGEMLRVARSQILLVFFLPPQPREAHVEHRGGYLRVRHDQREILKIIQGFSQFSKLTYEQFKGKGPRKTLYIVELKPPPEGQVKDR